MPDLTHPSPHHNSRGNAVVRCIVMHSDAGASDKGTLLWMADPVSKVSYHVLIGRQGTVYRIVEESRRAWHAGKSAWGGSKDVNAISLGLAFANKHDGHEALTPLQLASALDVVAEWKALYPIEAVVTHADVCIPIGRKRDPLDSPGFDLAHYQ